MFIILFVLIFLLRRDGTTCEATNNEVVHQVPYAVEILAARHPVRIGILRSAINDQGWVDGLAQAYVRSSMIPRQNPSKFDCYPAYYLVMFSKDKVRKAEADWIETQLDLK